MKLVLGSAAGGLRAVSNVGEVARYVEDHPDLNFALEVARDEKPLTEEDGLTPPVAIIFGHTPADLTEQIARVLQENCAAEKRAFLVHMLPPDELEPLQHDEEYRRMRLDVLRLRAQLLQLMPTTQRIYPPGAGPALVNEPTSRRPAQHRNPPAQFHRQGDHQAPLPHYLPQGYHANNYPERYADQPHYAEPPHFPEQGYMSGSFPPPQYSHHFYPSQAFPHVELHPSQGQ